MSNNNTQSVCKHCALKIAFYADRWRTLAGSPFCDHQGKVEHEPVSEPASTGEPPQFLGWVREKYPVLRNPIMLNYGDSLTSDNMKGIDCVTIVEEYARQFAAALLRRDALKVEISALFKKFRKRFNQFSNYIPEEDRNRYLIPLLDKLQELLREADRIR